TTSPETCSSPRCRRHRPSPSVESSEPSGRYRRGRVGAPLFSCTEKQSASTRFSSAGAPSSASSPPPAFAVRSALHRACAPFLPPARPLGPRRLRLPVTERIRADGVVHHPLDEADVLQALATFREEGVDSIAISFINAYADPRHELDAERVLRTAGFTGDISLSHRVSGEYREYERTSTTVIDPYVPPP